MIFDKLENISKYKQISDHLATAVEFIQSGALAKLPNGSHPIEGKNVYVNIFEYDTLPEDKVIWEGHRAYTDLHIVLDGEEKIYCNDETAMNAETEYDSTDDFVRFEGNANASFEMDRTVFLVTFPGEVHKPKVILQTTGHVRKAVVKIRM